MDFPLPPVGEGLIEVELVRWLVAPGDVVKRGQPLAELMSDKATMELPAPFAGTITRTLAEAGTKVKVGQVVLNYELLGALTEPLGAQTPNHTPPRVEESKRAVNGQQADEVLPAVRLPVAAPSIRHLARKFNLDLARVRGTGPGGRILLDDLGPFLVPTAAPAEAPKLRDVYPMDFGVPGTRVKLLGLRRKIAEHMVASKRAIPDYSYVDECDVTDLVRLRSQLKETYGKAGVRLTFLPFMVKATARALKQIPVVNSTFDEAAQEIQLHDEYNIGIAVAGPNGLVVPVIRNADRKDLAAIATEIERLSTDVRAGRPKVEDLRGGTFTITSIGNIGGLISTPIINHPEVAIMGIGKVVRRPVYDAHGDLRPADLVYLSFTFDHRIVDGAVGASFGNAVIKHLQNPASLLLPERFS